MLVFRYRGLKKDIIDIIFLMIFFLTLLFLCGGCAGAGRGYYQTPCSPPHLVGEKEAEELKRGKDDNAVIKCPECERPYDLQEDLHIGQGEHARFRCECGASLDVTKQGVTVRAK